MYLEMFFSTLLSSFFPHGMGSLVNRGNLSNLLKWKQEEGDLSLLSRSDWKLHDTKFFINICAISYENPRSQLFNKILHAWNIDDFTRTAARESAVAHVWTLRGDNDEAYCIVVFKGTSPFDLSEWLTDATVSPITPYKIYGDMLLTEDRNTVQSATVHRGFYDALWSVGSHHWENILHQINSACYGLPEKYGVIHLWVTGHSLGAAVASLAYARLLFNPKDIKDDRVELRGAYTFGTPRIGNKVFELSVLKQQKARKTKLYRVVNANDVITTIPFPDLTDEYVHVGEAKYLMYMGHLEDELTLKKKVINLVSSWKEKGEALLHLLDRLPFLLWMKTIEEREEMYSYVLRLIIPTPLLDHFPSEYFKHMKDKGCVQL